MGLSSEVRQLLLQGREEAVAELVVADRRALRPLMGRLWDPDAQIRQLAARAVGHAASVHSDLGLEAIRRLMWALNDESATNGVYAIPALGEIGRAAPELMAPFVSSLVSMSWDDGIRLELLRALTAIARTAPQLVAGHLPGLSRSIDETCPDERQALQRLTAAVEGFDDDE